MCDGKGSINLYDVVGMVTVLPTFFCGITIQRRDEDFGRSPPPSGRHAPAWKSLSLEPQHATLPNIMIMCSNFCLSHVKGRDPISAV